MNNLRFSSIAILMTWVVGISLGIAFWYAFFDFLLWLINHA